MPRRRVDEVATARILRQLDEHARLHPEAFDPDRLAMLSTPARLARALGEAFEARPPRPEGAARLGRPPSDDPMLCVTVRMPRSLLARFDAARGDRTRGDVVREALERWLRAERRRK